MPWKHMFKGYFKICGMSPVSSTTRTHLPSTKIVGGIFILDRFLFKLRWLGIFGDSHYQQVTNQELKYSHSLKYGHIVSHKRLINFLRVSIYEVENHHHAHRTSKQSKDVMGYALHRKEEDSKSSRPQV